METIQWLHGLSVYRHIFDCHSFLHNLFSEYYQYCTHFESMRGLKLVNSYAVMEISSFPSAFCRVFFYCFFFISHRSFSILLKVNVRTVFLPTHLLFNKNELQMKYNLVRCIYYRSFLIGFSTYFMFQTSIFLSFHSFVMILNDFPIPNSPPLGMYLFSQWAHLIESYKLIHHHLLSVCYLFVIWHSLKVKTIKMVNSCSA